MSVHAFSARLSVATMLATALLVVSAHTSRAQEAVVHYISDRVPVQAPLRELAADRPYVATTPRAKQPVGTGANPWRLQATLPGAVVHDIAFPTASVGYAAAELGQVWKTSDGGEHWTRIMNLGFPYYWYGVYAFSEQDLVVSGFDNQAFSAILRWSHDGGDTWSDDVVLTDQGWSMRVRFADADHGLVMDLVNQSAPNMAHYTLDGGAVATDWSDVVPDANGGWFGNQFSLLASGRARASGITYCDSADFGADWACRPPADPVFDGPTFFVGEMNGWVGGGSISPDVEGWVHRTIDGGDNWSARTLDVAWPIREILFLTDQIGWAVGGNIYSAEGGIYFSDDGGQTWSPDFDSEGHELDACANVGQKVWCAGYDASFNGAVYTLDLDPPAVDVSPGVLNFSVAPGATDSAPVTLTNTGGGSLTFAIDEAAQADCAVPGDVPWLGETPTEGSIAAGSSQDVSVEVDATGLADGYYAALLCIATNDPNLPLALLTVSLTVGGGDTIFKDGFEGVP